MAKLTAPEKKSAPPEAVRFGIRLSRVMQSRTDTLNAHPLNTQFFDEESHQYFNNLTSDIRERGIIVPLIAKSDGTLLAGHNRLRVARSLGLEYVPVQYVEENESWSLTEAQEREFIIKDNLFRRHLNREEWIQVYRNLYPDFDDAIMETSAGKRDGLTATKIAHDTGQKVDVVRKQLQNHKKAIKGEPRKQEQFLLSAKELRGLIEQALTALQMKDYAQAQEILEGGL